MAPAGCPRPQAILVRAVGGCGAATAVGRLGGRRGRYPRAAGEDKAVCRVLRERMVVDGRVSENWCLRLRELFFKFPFATLNFVMNGTVDTNDPSSGFFFERYALLRALASNARNYHATFAINREIFIMSTCDHIDL